MADREQPDTATTPTDGPIAGGQPASDHPLAGAEEAAAREAAAEAARAGPTTAAQDGTAAGFAPSDAGRPKVVRAKATTSRKAPAATHLAPPMVVEAVDAGHPNGVTRLDAVSIREAGAREVNATNVDVSRGGIGRARAVDIAVSQGGIGLARADRISVEMGGIGAALGGEVRVTQGAIGSVLARDVRIERAVVRSVVANNVRFERTTGVMLLVARRVEGDVRTLLDWRGAIAFGAAFGLVMSVLRRRK